MNTTDQQWRDRTDRTERPVLDLTPEQQRRLRWRNLSPVVERRVQDGVTIARHADGRFTLEASP